MKEQGKVRAHFKKHRKIYIAAGAGFAVGVVTVIILRERGYSTKVNMARILSPGDNNIMNVHINPLGDPGNVVQCLETGTVYASQGQAAREMGVAASLISRHLNGDLPDVKGNHMVILGKAGQPIAE